MEKIFPSLIAWATPQHTYPSPQPKGLAASVFLQLILFRREIAQTRRCVGEVGEEPYFHSHIFETVLPELSTSYSNAPHALFSRASFADVVLKNSIPR